MRIQYDISNRNVLKMSIKLSLFIRIHFLVYNLREYIISIPSYYSGSFMTTYLLPIIQ